MNEHELNSSFNGRETLNYICIAFQDIVIVTGTNALYCSINHLHTLLYYIFLTLGPIFEYLPHILSEYPLTSTLRQRTNRRLTAQRLVNLLDADWSLQ